MLNMTRRLIFKQLEYSNKISIQKVNVMNTVFRDFHHVFNEADDFGGIEISSEG